MAQNVYECMFILDSNRYAREPGVISAKIPEIIEKCGGEVLANRLWVEQKLAYPIEGHHKGTYWLTYFRMEGTNMPQMTRACKLEDAIVRHLVIKLDPRLADVMVSHALEASLPTPVAGVISDADSSDDITDASDEYVVDAVKED